ncbi:MAG: hypothetical protein DRP84_04800 [Spirochaetes bacterium]|nr:MAG: hypothetical protein DRP84_04800 [Spirochaetota bacterium]
MKSRKIRITRSTLILSLIAGFFLLYMGIIILLSTKLPSQSLIELISRNRIILYGLLFVFFVILVLVLYNLGKVVIDRIRNVEGSRLRFRLTVSFLLVALIPIIPLSIISNNLISRSINLWFMSGIEESLIDAINVSKLLFKEYSDDAVGEFKSRYSKYSLNELPKALEVNNPVKIDGIFLYDKSNNILQELYANKFVKDIEFSEKIFSNIKNSWERISFNGNSFIITPILFENTKILLIKKLPPQMTAYSNSISKGLQSYRTLKIIRKPIKKAMIILFYIVVTLPFLLLSFYLSLFISEDITTPIKELVVATEKIADNKFDYRVELESKNELKTLIDAFNDMVDELRINREIIKYSERSHAWQDIAKKLAHEIKNPLTPIKLSAERILKQYKNEDEYKKVLEKGIRTIIDEVNNINEMVSEFSNFARLPSAKMENVNVVEMLKQLISFLSSSYKDIGFDINTPKDNILIFVDKNQIRRALLNIIYNSINAIKEAGKPDGRIEMAILLKRENNRVVIAVSDNGPGIDDEIKEKIFNPYFSKIGKGSGLGLAIVEKIVYDNRGRIWFDSKPGRTTFFMEFERV